MNKMNIDLLWVNKISYKLDQFKPLTSYKRKIFNSRCPICLDSKRKKSKKRFYIYEKQGSINVICHNCGYSSSFYRFIKEQFPFEFENYKIDLLRERFKEKETFVKPEPVVEERIVKNLVGCVSIESLPKDHFCVKYLDSRKLLPYKDRFLFSEDFFVTAEKFSYSGVEHKKFPKGEPRLIIPFFGEDGEIRALQGRSFDPKSPVKYITLKSSEDALKWFGLERINKKKPVYCIEGPIDSLFVENCIATCDSNLTQAEADFYIWDNQPRSKEIVRLMESAVMAGRGVVIWPDMGDEKVDINELIIRGMTKGEVMRMIKERSFKGLRAKLEFAKWRKV